MIPPSSGSSPEKSVSGLAAQVGAPGVAAGTNTKPEPNNAALGQAAGQAANLELNIKIFKRNLGNAAVSRVLDLIDLVLSEPSKTLATYDFWQHLCQNYATPQAALRITLPKDQIKFEDEHETRNTRLYTLNVNTAPRYFLANVLATNIVKQQVFLPGIRFHVLNSGSVFMASRLSIIYTYIDGSSAHATGVCRIILSRDFRIDSIDCHVTNHSSQISLLHLEKMWLASCKNDGTEKDFMKRVFSDTILKTTAKDCGFDENAIHILQISDVMSQLRPLMAFTTANQISSPIKALESYVNMNLPNSHFATSNSNVTAAASPPINRNMANDAKSQLKKRRLSSSIDNSVNPESR